MKKQLSVKIQELEAQIKSLKAKQPKTTLKLEKVHETLGVGMRKNGRKYSVRTNRDRFFYPDEWMKFFDCLRHFQKPLFKFLINTGARINEAIHVKVEDIDILNKRIILRVTKVRSKRGEKNPRPRIIPISTQFAKWLKSYITKNNFHSNKESD